MPTPSSWVMTATIAERPSIGPGLRRIVVTAPSRISPTPRGRRGITPGLTTGGGAQPHCVLADEAACPPQPPDGAGAGLLDGDRGGSAGRAAPGAWPGAAHSDAGGCRVDQPGYGGSLVSGRRSSSSGRPQPGVSDIALAPAQVAGARAPVDSSAHRVTARLRRGIRPAAHRTLARSSLGLLVAPLAWSHSDPRSFLARAPRCSIGLVALGPSLVPRSGSSLLHFSRFADPHPTMYA
jgi:hypothetical protein